MLTRSSNKENISDITSDIKVISKSIPTLLCQSFQDPLHMDFGVVAVKSTTRLLFKLMNPSNEKSVRITIDKVPIEKGFTVLLGELGETSVVVPANSSVIGTTIWIPDRSTDGVARTPILLKLDKKFRLQLTLIGNAVNTKEGNNLNASQLIGKPENIKNNPKKLKKPLIHTTKLEERIHKGDDKVVLHMDNDIVNQLNDFKIWINTTFMSHTFDEKAIISEGLNILNDPCLVSVVEKIGCFIDNCQILTREDKDIVRNIGLQVEFIDLLFNIELAWLKLALQILFSIQEPKNDVKKFRRIILDAITGGAISNFKSSKYMAKDELQKFMKYANDSFMKNFLTLMIFLDTSRLKRVLNIRNLFCKSSKFKSCNEIIVVFTSMFLKSEGDIIKKLQPLEFHLKFQQSYIDEVDCMVSDIRQDLKDGVVISRLFDVISRPFEISSKLRVPAVSLTQKIFNVKLVLSMIYRSSSIEILEETAKKFVAGDITSIVTVLWNICYFLDLKRIVNVRNLVSVIHKSDADITDKFDIKEMLIQWCQLVAKSYNVQLNQANLVASFCDGYIFCLLVHFYAPSFIDLSKTAGVNDPINFYILKKAASALKFTFVVPSSTTLDESTLYVFLAYLFSRLFSVSLEIKSAQVVQRLFRKKFIKAKKCEFMSPNIQIFKSSRVIFDERKLESLKENRMAYKIQRFWKEFKFRCNISNLAVLTIQKWVRSFIFRKSFLKLKNATTKFQRVWRIYLSKCMLNTKMLNSKLEMDDKLNAAKFILRWYKSRLMLNRIRLLVKGLRKFIGLLRGFCARKKVCLQARDIRSRLIDATSKLKADSSLAIGAQTKLALNTLREGKMISSLLKACSILQFNTAFSKKSCEELSVSTAPSILFELIRSCNRSNPHQELLRHALQILLNVTKYSDFADLIAKTTDSIDIIIDLLQTFRDKNYIFCLSCLLLIRLVSASPESKQRCRSAEYSKRLSGIRSIIERKCRLDEKINATLKTTKSSDSTFDLQFQSEYNTPIKCINALYTELGK